jgi:hypothetical protein
VPPGASDVCCSGQFRSCGAGLGNLVVARGTQLDLLAVGEDGEVHTICSQPVCGTPVELAALPTGCASQVRMHVPCVASSHRLTLRVAPASHAQNLLTPISWRVREGLFGKERKQGEGCECIAVCGAIHTHARRQLHTTHAPHHTCPQAANPSSTPDLLLLLSDSGNLSVLLFSEALCR